MTTERAWQQEPAWPGPNAQQLLQVFEQRGHDCVVQLQGVRDGPLRSGAAICAWRSGSALCADGTRRWRDGG
jgi:hypothetical protein